MLIGLANLYEWFGLTKEQAHHSLWFVALETFILITGFMLLVEIAGRKTMAQMTMLQMIVTIGIGESLLLPVIDEDFSILKTFVIVAVLITFVIINEWLEIKLNWFERLFTRKAKIIIEDGELNIKNLSHLRMSIDQLEIALRNHGIESIKHLKTCTIEANGQLGIQLKAEEKALTKKDFMDFLNKQFSVNEKIEDDIFIEIRNDEHKIKSKHNHSKQLK